MSSSLEAPTKELKEAGFRKFFTSLAPNYGYLTGYATRDILSGVLDAHGADLSLKSSSVILDNAAGPGTATEAIIKWNKSHGISEQPSFTVTDFVPAMIEAVDAHKLQNPDWKTVTAQVMDSQALTFEANTFTHTFCNFSIFTFTSSSDALSEIYRTLRPGGIAVVTCWKRFGVDEIWRAAQRIIKGEDYSNPIKMAGPEFAQEGYLQNSLAKAGWKPENLRTVEKSVTLTGTNLEGLVEFMSGNFVGMALNGWSDEDKGKWPEAVREAVAREVKEDGGVVVTGWAVIATK